MARPTLDAVIIGRNEGDRLRACLGSLSGAVDRVVYVDSGSSDGSPDVARDMGAVVVDLDMSQPFTAARARNAGFGECTADYVQFVDGDCTLVPGWIETAAKFLIDNPDVGVACGRRRELSPDATVYNRLCDIEWNTPVGEAKACGGDALMRRDALQAVGGFRDDLIAGEEPELCVRLRAAGWRIWRLDADMTRHDAAITRFSQWWQRSKRAGHAFAQGAGLHGAPPERHWVRETRRALFWGGVLPVVTVGLSAISLWAAVLFLAYPVQVARLSHHSKDSVWALFTVLGKFPEALGALQFYRAQMLGSRNALIEYK